MIRGFADRGTEDVFNGIYAPTARRACPQQLWGTAFRKLDLIDSAVELGDLVVPPGNHLDALRGTRQGQRSIRINDQYRICFRWSEAGAADGEITDYHN